jgi:hypothetical protein
MILATGSIYGLTVDTRWTHGVFTYRDGNGETVEYELPFIGWATEVTWTAPAIRNRSDITDDDTAAKNETDIVPVFLTTDDPINPVTLQRINDDSRGSNTLKALVNRTVKTNP